MMGMLSELFSSPEGILSLIVLVAMFAIGAYFIRLFITKMNSKNQ